LVFDDESAKQVRRNAEWLRGFLRDVGPAELPIQPIIVVPGWYVETKGQYPVMAMNAKYLNSYLAGRSGPFSREQLKPVLRRLEEYCRDLEF
jgi:hypothetical protein